MLEVVWFKKDLRLSDHRALTEAIASSKQANTHLFLLYLYEDSIISGEDMSRRHLLFSNECLEELSGALEHLGQTLYLIRGEAVEILSYLNHQYGIKRIWSHEETGNALTYSRDKQVAAWCKEKGVTWHEVPQNGVVRRLKNRNGWSTRWAKRMSHVILPIPEIPNSPKISVQIEHSQILAPEAFAKKSLGEMTLQPGGSKHAHELIQSFLSDRGQTYTKAMSSPVTAYNACSRISPYLTFGAMSIREAYHYGKTWQDGLKSSKLKREAKEKSNLSQWRSALRSLMGRLRWHCHFMQKLEDEPELEWRNLFSACDGLREDDWNEQYFEAWATGHTGYPMVDACMRALIATGWLNFRMRAMLMSFASYHLWLNWRPTGLHLARLFTDYEPGIHWSQVQMQSGTTGINSIRIYSPTKQAMDQDPQGVFIRQWVPELKQVPQTYLFEPYKMPKLEQQMCSCVMGENYPEPVVEHATAYKQAQQKIRSVRRPANKDVRQKIYKKHGSRKRPQQTREGE